MSGEHFSAHIVSRFHALNRDSADVFGAIHGLYLRDLLKSALKFQSRILTCNFGGSIV